MPTAITPDPDGTTEVLTPEDSDVPDAAGHLVLFQPIANHLARVDRLLWLGWLISEGVYSDKSLDVSSESSFPDGIVFSADGTKAYLPSPTDETIYQYTLSTAWDISTGTYASKSLDVSSQDTEPKSVTLSADGTSAYVLGETNQTVYQYTLSTAWDISTGTYASKSLDVSSQEGSPTGFEFSADGTKGYVVGTANDTIFQYTLSVAWDISTGSYASKSLSVASEATAPSGLAFSADGTKGYVIGTANDTIYQYTLSTAWDIGTGSYANKSLDVSSEEGQPRGLAFSVDGTKMYIVGSSNDTIYQYYTSRAVND